MTAALAVTSRAILAKVTATSAHVAKIVDVLPLTTPEEEAKAGRLLRTLETLDREADAARTQDKAPHLEAGRAVDEAFRGPRSELQRVVKLLRGRIEQAALAREEARRKAQAALVAAVKADDAPAANEAALAVLAVPEVGPSEGVSERFTYEVAGIAIADVPREFLAVDMTRVRAEIAAADRDGREPRIPGITFRRVARLIVRGLR